MAWHRSALISISFDGQLLALMPTLPISLCQCAVTTVMFVLQLRPTSVLCLVELNDGFMSHNSNKKYVNYIIQTKLSKSI